MNHTDLELLRRFEPVLRFTRGEKFFPIDADSYVKESSLWVQHPDQPAERLVPEEDLDLEYLGQCHTPGFGATYFLQFIEPLNLADLAAYLVRETLRKKDPQNVFRSGRGRLSRVGYTSRLLDSLFSLSLLARGRLPGDRAIAAAATYDRMLANNGTYHYHGRVIRQSGWVVLQYWFFYVYNNWRSGYYGANDHEADWEMVNLYLYEDDGSIHPEWAAYASHDFSGDDLRRRWDDPELEKMGDHPVVYVGSGSHASYFARGEYLTEVEIPFLSPFARLLEAGQKMIRKWLRRTIGEEVELHNKPLSVFRIPFVDYARGDGFSIGEGGQAGWGNLVPLDPLPAWAENYRGLWGYYARDPLAGENAPAGVCYNRDGSMRRAWYDPVGWAGLDKVPPPPDRLSLVMQRKSEILADCQVLSHQIAQKQHQLYDLGIELNAMRDLPHLKNAFQDQIDRMDDLSSEIQQLRDQRTQNESLVEVLADYEEFIKLGKRSPPRAHLKRPPQPEKESDLRLGWLAEVWSAVSIGIMLIAFLALAIFARHYLFAGLAAILGLVVLIEAGFRRRLSNLLNTVAIVLAVVSFLVLVYQYYWIIIVGLVSIASLYMIWQNLRELWA